MFVRCTRHAATVLALGLVAVPAGHAQAATQTVTFSPTAMPAGLTLSVRLAAPTEGTSTSFQPLGPVAVDLVAGITKLAQNTLGVTYKLDATPAAGAVTSATRTVIFTITGGV